MTFETIFMHGYLLLSIVGAHHGDELVAVTKQAGATGGTIMQGRGTASSKILAFLGIGDTEKEVVLTLLDAHNVRAVMDAVIQAGAEDHKHLGGVALLLDVRQVLRRIPTGSEVPMDGVQEEGMASKWELITVIVNKRYADEAMAVARAAGAFGGTIINGKGTGTEEDVKFFGVPLVPEKEMLLILAEKSNAPAIKDAVRQDKCLQEPGSGIMFSMDVQEFSFLGAKQ